MRVTTSLSLEQSLLDQAKEYARDAGTNFSAWTERLIQRELFTSSAATAAAWEREQGRDSAAYFEQVEAQRAAVAAAIRDEHAS
ncbi:hypothetical protein [Nocardia altamirensis]|uniref:hypothetical protein n=1 Tax=Nocardia altamirensis TaxID=472158 RepID=UPI000840011D|nr:hypothetical protein [Nocardia altamirensis]